MPSLNKKKSDKKSTKKQKKPSVSSTKKLKDKIISLELKLENIEDKNIRLLAEFDNYKKRKNTEIDNLIKYEGYDFFKNLIGILDDIDRTLKIKDVMNNKSIYKGISMIKNKIISFLDSKNIKSFNSKNELFNPDYHEALMVKKSSKEPGFVLEEYEIGYNYKDKVLRHAKVIVSE
jgi:molecular chaperone GrpE